MTTEDATATNTGPEWAVTIHLNGGGVLYEVVDRAQLIALRSGSGLLDLSRTATEFVAVECSFIAAIEAFAIPEGHQPHVEGGRWTIGPAAKVA